MPELCDLVAVVVAAVVAAEVVVICIAVSFVVVDDAVLCRCCFLVRD